MDATTKFISLKDEIDSLVSAISAASEDHFDVDPDALDWGDVGSLARLRDQLAHAIADYAPLAARAQ